MLTEEKIDSLIKKFFHGKNFYIGSFFTQVYVNNSKWINIHYHQSFYDASSNKKVFIEKYNN